MLRLHDYAASGNCWKIRTALALLGRDYERVPVDIFAGDTLTDAFAAMNPQRRTPVLELAPGVFLAESNAILLHLAEGSALLPADPVDRAHVYQWLFFEQTAFEPTVGSARFWRLTGRADARPDRFASVAVQATSALDLLDAHRAGRRFVAGGAFSIADRSLYAYAHRAGEADLPPAERPHLDAWLARVADVLDAPGVEPTYPNYPDNARPGHGRTIHS